MHAQAHSIPHVTVLCNYMVGICCSVGYQHKISFVHKLFLSCIVVSKFCTSRDTVVLCWKLKTISQLRWGGGMDERDFTRFRWGISYNATAPKCCLMSGTFAGLPVYTLYSLPANEPYLILRFWDFIECRACFISASPVWPFCTMLSKQIS